MITIIEGVDGSGKTTLCKNLKEQGYETVHFDLPENVDAWLTALIKFDDINVVTDRSFISDIVYRLRDGENRRGMDLNSMCCILKQVKIVHCESGTEFNDSMLRGEDSVTTYNENCYIKHLYNIVMNLFERFLDVKICKYNWHEDTLDKVINFIKEV